MKEEKFTIIVSPKRDADSLGKYVDSGFKTICDWEKRDHRDIKFLSFCFGVMIFVVWNQGIKLKKLEKQIKELKKEEPVEVITNNDPLEEVPVE